MVTEYLRRERREEQFASQSQFQLEYVKMFPRLLIVCQRKVNVPEYALNAVHVQYQVHEWEHDVKKGKTSPKKQLKYT